MVSASQSSVPALQFAHPHLQSSASFPSSVLASSEEPERLHFQLPSHRRPSRSCALSSSLLQGGKGLCIAMAGAMRAFLATFLVVAVAAVAVHAHNGEDHGPAAAPHASESGAATLVASLLAPLLVAAGAFAASALQL